MRFLLVWVLLSHRLVAFSHILLLLCLPSSLSPSLSLPLLHRDLPRRQPLLGAQAPLLLHPSWHLFCCRRLGLSLFPRLYRGGCCCSCFLSSKRRRDLPPLLLPYPHGWVCWYVMGLLLSSLPPSPFSVGQTTATFWLKLTPLPLSLPPRIGTMAVGLISALSCFEVAPGILKSLAEDRSIHWLSSLDLGRVYSFAYRDGVPVRAILLTSLLVLPFFFVPNIDLVARCAAVCFLTMVRFCPSFPPSLPPPLPPSFLTHS